MRVGKRIKQIVSIVESIGGATTRDIKDQLPDEPTTHTVGTYCSRAVGLGLMTADRSGYRIVFRAIDGWRDRARPQPRARGQKLVDSAIKTQPNSVFALGQI